METVATLTGILASLAVIPSLIFVGVQMRQSGLATRMMTAQINTQIMIENFNTLIDHPDLAAIFAGERPRENISPGERIRIGNVFASTFRHMEMLHMHQRYGVHEKEMWEASEARLEERITNPVIRAWWATSKQSYSPSFVAFVDARIYELLKENPIDESEEIVVWEV